MKTLHYFCKLFVSPEVVQTKKLVLHKRTPMQPHSKVNPQIFIGSYHLPRTVLGPVDAPVKLRGFFPWIFTVN